MNHSPNWTKVILYLAGMYNIIWGIIVVTFPIELFEIAGMKQPNYPELFQCIGMMIAVFGVAYLAAAPNPLRHWPIVLAGLLGRILGPIGFIYSAVKGTFTWIAGITIITNDLIWLLPFSLILYKAFITRHLAIYSEPLYKRIIDKEYYKLPRTIQKLHDLNSEASYKGQCYVKRGNTFLVKILANLLSIPQTGNDIEIIVNFKKDGNTELWDRSFNGQKLQSIQWQIGKLLYEKFNFTTLVFRVLVNNRKLELDFQKAYLFGIALPSILRPKITARETEKNGKFHFFVKCSHPLIGLLVQYEGSLVRVKR